MIAKLKNFLKIINKNNFYKKICSKKIKEQYDYQFSIPEDGVYIISIEASCDSGRMLGLFGGEDLRVEIDDIKLREIPAEKHAQYSNIPPAWNGTELKGRPKTVLFILKLNKGDHNIKFIPKKSTVIHEEPKVRLFDSNKILENIQSEERNRQPWITIALINLPLNILDVSVTCEKRKYDSDDIKLIIDGKIKKNKQSGWWGKNWYFKGNELQGDIIESRFYPKLETGIHYIEFWADRKPVINYIDLDIGAKINKEEKKKDIDNIPTVDNPKWTGNFDDDAEQMILARAIWGEARSTSEQARIAVAWSIKNRLGERSDWNSYHHIILDEKQYSAFWEKPPKDPNVKALKDPLGTTDNFADHQKWRETYEIAGKVMSGEIPDPTSGSTHYYDDSIEPPYWAKNIKFKIENLNFFYSK